MSTSKREIVILTFLFLMLSISIGISLFMRDAQQGEFNNIEDNNDIIKNELDQKINYDDILVIENTATIGIKTAEEKIGIQESFPYIHKLNKVDYFAKKYDNFKIELPVSLEFPEIPAVLFMEYYSDIFNNNPSEPSNDLLHFEIFKIFYNWEEEKNKLITINKNELNSFLPFDDYFIFPIGNVNNTDSLKLTNIGKFYPELYKRKEPEYFPEDLKCTRLFVINKNSDSIYFSAIKEEIILIEEPESDKYYVITNELSTYKKEYELNILNIVKSASKEELLERINSGYVYTRSFWEPDQLWDYYLHSTGVDWKQEDGSDIEIQDVLFDVIDISRGNTNGADVLMLTSEVYIDGEFLTYANLYVPIANWGDQNLTRESISTLGYDHIFVIRGYGPDNTIIVNDSYQSLALDERRQKYTPNGEGALYGLKNNRIYGINNSDDSYSINYIMKVVEEM